MLVFEGRLDMTITDGGGVDAGRVGWRGVIVVYDEKAAVNATTRV